jgi:hypothetical protein
MKPSCEKLTFAIQDLQILLPRVDLAINSFGPEDGVLAKDEAMGILEEHLFRSFFKQDAYDYFVKVLDGEERLREVAFILKTAGKSGKQILEELGEAALYLKHIKVPNSAEDMLRSPEFKVVNATEKIMTIRLQVSELFSDENTHTYAEILSRAKELGLDFLPHETAAVLLMDKKTQPKIFDYYSIASEPITCPVSGLQVFNVENNGAWLFLSSHTALPGIAWGPRHHFVFAVRNVED